ncbi:uncharacterized protein LOC131073259 isoform X2 [Cryptomeria japonica]|nr:uncharacterized protein LOC131073259 isoform X2 [Cryptomeria japonica]
MASASSTGDSRFRTEPGSPLWKYVEMVQQLPGGGGFLWICRHCKEEYKSSYSRVKAHLCFIPQKGIKFCPGKSKVPGQPRPKTLLANNIVLKYIEEQRQADEAVGNVVTHTLERSRSKKATKASMSLTSNEQSVEGHPFLNLLEQPVTNKRAKGPLEMSFQNEAGDIAEEDIGRCIYANGLAFNVVCSPYWQKMVRSINEAPRGFKGPGYEKVRTILLDKEVKNVENSLKPIRDSWIETGVSIVSDGWKDARNCPLVNVLAVYTRGAMFLRAVDCEGQLKDSPFIANILFQAIEQVGPQNVVQVITDNAKNCRAAGLLVEERYKHIFWTPCAVHSLNLMLQKIGNKIEWIKKMYGDAQEIQMFITNHHMSQAIFRQFSRLELLKVAETRFASQTIVLRRLVKVKEALSRMVTNANWSIWRQSIGTRGAAIKAMILDDSWWDLAEYLLRFTEPILSMNRYTDMDRPCLGEVYDGIDSMIKDMKTIINQKEQDPEEKFFKEIQKIMVERWNKMTTRLHLLAFALSPKYYSREVLNKSSTRVAPYRDHEVAIGYKAALRRLFPDSLRAVVRAEVMSFTSTDDCGIEALEDKANVDAHKWWYYHGEIYQNLQPIAVKVLSQVASSSSSERNWSTYSFIHSIKRNKLHSKKAEDLVYVHSNLRLLTHKDNTYKQGEAKHWDVELEHAELDDSIARLNALGVDDDNDELLGDHEAAPEAEIASTTASGTVCASNLPQEDDDDMFDDF